MPSCVHGNRCGQDKLSALTCFDRLALFESTSYLQRKKGGVSESIREQRCEHRWSQSATGQGVSHRLTGLWVFHLPPSQAYAIKLTLNGIIGTTVRIQVRVRKWEDAALGSKWLLTCLSTAAHVAAMEVYTHVKIQLHQHNGTIKYNSQLRDFFCIIGHNFWSLQRLSWCRWPDLAWLIFGPSARSHIANACLCALSATCFDMLRVMHCGFPVAGDKRSMRMTYDLFVETQQAKHSSAKCSDQWWGNHLAGNLTSCLAPQS